MNKYFKKYGYYFAAIFSLLLKNYGRAIKYFSEVMRYDFFLFNSSEKYINAVAKCKETKRFVIRGGVGDILQSLPFMLLNKSRDYFVLTHFTQADIFFEKIGLSVSEFCFYANGAEYKSRADGVYKSQDVLISPRSLYFESNPFASGVSPFENDDVVVGVHLGASVIESNKSLPIEFLRILFDTFSLIPCNFLVFCNESELSMLHSREITETERLKLICHSDITVSLGLVSLCDYFVGSDSAFKTMAAMLRIPTFVLFENTKNGFRDRAFIDRYVDDGVIFAFRPKRIDDAVMRKVAVDMLTKIKEPHAIDKKSSFPKN